MYHTLYTVQEGHIKCTTPFIQCKRGILNVPYLYAVEGDILYTRAMCATPFIQYMYWKRISPELHAISCHGLVYPCM